MVADSVMDDVQVVMQWAKEQKINVAAPGDGARTVFDEAVASERFRQERDYLGVAGNLFWLDLKSFAVKGVYVSKLEATHYGQHTFLVPLREGRPIELKQAVGVAVIGGQTPGLCGTWRRLSLDLQTFGFISAWASLIRAKPNSGVTLKSLAAFRETALRCPMDFHFFGAKPDIEKQIFLKAFSIMEDFRKNEEMHAPGGWQVCCLFHQAKELQRVHSKGGAVPDPVADLCDFFADFEFAKTSEYKLDKKVGKECLTVYERVTTSGAQDILTQARVFLGPKNCLDQVSKLIAISQKVSASCQPSGPAGERMAFVLGFVYIRLRCGRTHESIGVRSLKTTELPTAILAHKVLQHTLATYKFTSKIELEILGPMGSPFRWFNERAGHDADVTTTITIATSTLRLQPLHIVAKYILRP